MAQASVSSPPSPPAPHASPQAPLWLHVVKWASLAAIVAFGLWVSNRMINLGYGVWIVLVAFIVMSVLVVYSTRRFIPMKYLLPGLILLLGLQVWPMVQTVATSFTNYGLANSVTKEQATNITIANSVFEVEGAQRYRLSIAVPEGADPATGELTFLLTDGEGVVRAGTIDGITDIEQDGIEKTTTGKVTAAPGYTVLDARQVNARSADLNTFAVPTPDGRGGIKNVGLSEAFQGEATMVYDEAADTVTDTRTGKVYIPQDGRWTPQDGQGAPLTTGWRENVGLKNFQTIFTDPVIRGGFLKIFLWNVAFAALSVITTFLLGMLLALLLNDPRVRGKGIYRSLLILPYAIPGFVTALLWAAMFNRDYGLVNDLTGLSVNWLGGAWSAKAAILITNLWLGFPYMFLICSGALQSIPGDVREAAKIDGANAFQTLRKIIMPLLLVAVGPLLIASFAFNFNNFGLIYLLTGGGPFEGANTSIGSTDLLITYAFRLAFSGVSPNYGLASAVSIVIFAIVALMSYTGFRRTKQLEEIN
ncbi:MAG TPA: ABC transporter permease subunit [Intrasporangiaceae bacterium]|nr:ABC transporter permease subunit [Intrasporangiaceae bacterium]